MTRQEYMDFLWGIYAPIKTLSRKNNCSVLLIRHKELGRDIVLRSYPKAVDAYERLKAFRHDNIASVYDAMTLDDGQIVLEEYVDGVTVAEVLQSGYYKYRGAKKVITHICGALSALHRLNIIHRDVKPENIIIDGNGNSKLIDLNASRLYAPNAKKDTETLGTIGYAPPEQFGIAQSGEKADIYSVGVLLNVMLTGKHPSEALAKGKAGRIVLKCTQIDPNSRFASVEKLVSRL